MASPFKNILLIGATGSIGSHVFKALSDSPHFTVTLLQRASSKATLPSHLRVITIADSYPTDELTQAFKGQDVIVNCMTSLSVSDQFRMIDAAIAAGVKRYVPSEYGLNNMRPDAQALNRVFHDKGKVQEYLRAKAADGAIEWMSVSCGMWVKWSMEHEFLGMHVREKRFVFWDDGEGLFSCTTEENTAVGLVRALEMRESTKNTNVYLSDFAISQRQLLEAIERIQGAKYETEYLSSYDLIKEKQEAVRNGDNLATFDLIETGFVTGRFGGHLEKEGELFNSQLGLPKKTVDEVVEAALRYINHVLGSKIWCQKPLTINLSLQQSLYQQSTHKLYHLNHHSQPNNLDKMITTLITVLLSLLVLPTFTLALPAPTATLANDNHPRGWPTVGACPPGQNLIVNAWPPVCMAPSGRPTRSGAVAAAVETGLGATFDANVEV
ncbi:NAD(P)-binding protein [Aaosphaeria arxii CBS 175.79]|uniref:NAD(P)-binding protein n=1 Tax=Aaosphaeria arxii CBS 175.79 TaxID=1450172 RepID=A0A6A5X713_9PLEO|nr:NAD(P)-binding protein [Aaosphaeria arxii CBS 175.79]KAF2008805.1 NAD(P)-binding protein [Aaosphaeria arxii CBS 175.79]